MGKLGYVLFFLSGIYMYVAEIVTFYAWWHSIGCAVAIFIPPVTAFFPIIYWIKTGVCPILYFAIWGIGILGVILVNIFSHPARNLHSLERREDSLKNN